MERRKKRLSVDGKRLHVAVLLSLLFSLSIMVPTVAIVGISPLGKQSIGSSPTMTYANATTWSFAFSAFGGSPIFFIALVAGALVLLVVMALILHKDDVKEAATKCR